jgi:hypothetical protein
MQDSKKEELYRGWTTLGPDAKYTCGKCRVGHSSNEADEDRCGEKAVWEKKSQCTCGQMCFVRRYCDSCIEDIVLKEKVE